MGRMQIIHISVHVPDNFQGYSTLDSKGKCHEMEYKLHLCKKKKEKFYSMGILPYIPCLFLQSFDGSNDLLIDVRCTDL